MKFLYVLVSSESDFYYEQALISMMSAKFQMPNCSISLLTERETGNNLKGSRDLINEYISEKKVIDMDASLSPMQKSRWLKTFMRELIKDDFLYVDVDTVFAAPIDESLFSKDIMGVPDGNCPLKNHPMKWFIEDNLKKVHFDNTLDYHINSGVLFFKDTPIAHSFAQKWHEKWLESCQKGIYIDQPALHRTIAEFGDIFNILPDFMNAQFGRNINTLAKGVILHYYSSWGNISSYTPAYKFLQKEWLEAFRNNPKSEVFTNLIKNPKEAFDQNTFIIGKKENYLFNSKSMSQLMNIRIDSTDRADRRIYKILITQNRIITFFYYKFLSFFSPLYRQTHKKISN